MVKAIATRAGYGRFRAVRGLIVTVWPIKWFNFATVRPSMVIIIGIWKSQWTLNFKN